MNLNPFRKAPKIEQPRSNLSIPAAIMITIAGFGLLLEKGLTKSNESFTGFKKKIELSSPEEKAAYAKSVYKLFESKKGNLGEQGFRFFPSNEVKVLDIHRSNEGIYISAIFDSTSAESGTHSVEGIVHQPSFKEVSLYDKNSDGIIDGYSSQRATGLELPTEEGETMYTSKSNHNEIEYESIPKRGAAITPEDQLILNEINSSLFPIVLKALENEATNLK